MSKKIRLIRYAIALFLVIGFLIHILFLFTVFAAEDECSEGTAECVTERER